MVSFTLNGGRVIVEGGEVGYVYRKSGTTTDLDPAFRRNILNDSTWVSDRSSNDLVISTPDHPIFTTPNPDQQAQLLLQILLVAVMVQGMK